MTYIPEEQWANTVEHMPIPSVDMVVVNDDDEFLLGRRNRRPARDLWFVPGGRILKDETVYNAVHRQAREELNIAVEITNELGWYEHFYDDSDVGEDISKHYVALAFECRPISGGVDADEHHEEFRWFSEPPKATHEYTQVYLRDAEVV